MRQKKMAEKERKVELKKETRKRRRGGDSSSEGEMRDMYSLADIVKASIYLYFARKGCDGWSVLQVFRRSSTFCRPPYPTSTYCYILYLLLISPPRTSASRPYHFLLLTITSALSSLPLVYFRRVGSRGTFMREQCFVTLIRRI